MLENKMKKVINLIYIVFIVFVACLIEYIILKPSVSNVGATLNEENNKNYSHIIVTGKFFVGSVPEKVKEIYTIDEKNMVVNIRVTREFEKMDVAQEQYENATKDTSLSQVELRGKMVVANRNVEPGLTKDNVLQTSISYVRTGGGVVLQNTSLYEIEQY